MLSDSRQSGMSKTLTSGVQVGRCSGSAGEPDILSTVRIGGTTSSDSLRPTRRRFRRSARGPVGWVRHRLSCLPHSGGIHSHLGRRYSWMIAVKHSRRHGRKSWVHRHRHRHTHANSHRRSHCGHSSWHRPKFRNRSRVELKSGAVMDRSIEWRGIHEHGGVDGKVAE